MDCKTPAMTTSKLQQIATNLDGKYTVEDYTVTYHNGAKSYDKRHVITYDYLGAKTVIFVQEGAADSARIITTLPDHINYTAFEINCISLFEKMFWWQKSRFKVICKNQDFYQFLTQKALVVFDKRMKKDNFNPHIFTQKSDLSNQIVIEFHLGFSAWWDIFEEINQFLQIILQKLNTNNTYRVS